MRFLHGPLRRLVSGIFAANGSEQSEAELIGDHLVEANLAGHDSHGVIRTPIYIQWLRNGDVVANRQLKIIHEMDSLALVDGQQGYGQSIGMQIVELGLKKCQRHGAAVVAVRNSGHLGRIGHWAELAADAGCVSLHFVNTSGKGMFVVPAGGVEPRLSVNPVTIGVPVEGRPHIILDIAAAAAAEGKLKVARNAGNLVPDNWILDANGQPTSDPNAFYGPPMGAILPIAGHKGYGLSFMVELLAGALTGNGCSQKGKTRLEQGMLSIFVDPSQLPVQNFFGPDAARYIDFVKSCKPATAGNPVLVPGEVEVERRQERTDNGIELDNKTWQQIVASAQECGVSQSLIDKVIKS
ncbi:MAG: malate/lactate/ureidoglycolate dehydrogenase [Fuerstiella sp.]|nr:malate/lactate/ureidoglycolate dehydrogenase [Fuerstiella sp.]MCP4509900.1 malate/lactate/ureidoglycolate dehydrogenase [Fuerstiella sp.]